MQPTRSGDRTVTRRRMLGTLAGVAGGSTWTLIARRSAAAGMLSANDRITVAAIGTGGRGSGIGHQAGQLGEMVACADVDLDRARKFASRYEGRCAVFGDYRRVLDREDVDAVTIGTPDHWHVKIAIDAMRAGKDVYCEKPLTLTIDEGKTICRVVEETGAVFQVGTQQRSEFDGRFLKAVAMAKSGRLGETLTATCAAGDCQPGGPFANSAPPASLDWEMWLGQAPLVPYCANRCHHDFRWWLEYSGGQVTDWGVHVVDIGMWALGVDGTGPTEIEGTGEFPKVENGYNVATRFDTTMRFANGNTVILNSEPGGSILIEGEKGRILVNRGRLVGKPIEDLTKAEQQWLEEEALKLYGAKEPGSHMRNFFDCMRDRSQPASNVVTHHRTVSACHLANITMRLNRKLVWDPASETFPHDEEANGYLSRVQRSGYEIA